MNQKGFTLIEILIVVAIFGLLGTLSSIAVGSARSKMRDVKRVSDVRILQSALEDHFKETSRYPEGSVVRLGDPASSSCLSTNGFTASCQGATQTFLPSVPAEFERGLSGAVKCGNPPQTGYCYTAVQNGSSYRVGFEIEHTIAEAGIVKGANCLIPEVGIKSGVCPE